MKTIQKKDNVRPRLISVGLICLLLLFADGSYGKVRLPGIVSDNMVLEQKSDVPVWGKELPGTSIDIKCSWGAKAAAKADNTGNWKAIINTPAAGGPFRIAITGSSIVVLKNVMAGEVWLCSRQLNMDMKLQGNFNEPVENSNQTILESANPLLRVFTVKPETSLLPKDDVAGDWNESSPATSATYSAAAYHFGKMIQQTLRIPVGLIISSYSGTSIIAWSDRKALSPFPEIEVPVSIPEYGVGKKYSDPGPQSKNAWAATLEKTDGCVLSLDSANDKTRRYWTDLAWKTAAPVLSNMAKGKLHQSMTIEVSPIWDGRTKDVAYMEAFGRLMAGIAPWLNLPDDNTEEGKKRYQLRKWALQSYKNAVDPNSPDYLLWRGHTQALVDAAYIVESFLRGYDQLWTPLDDATKKRYIEEFTGMRRYETPYNNWVLFSAVIESFLLKAGAPYDQYRINTAIRKVEEWYLGDGLYADGQGWEGDNKTVLSFDYYSSYVIHAMYLETLQTCIDANVKSSFIDYKRYYSRALKRTQRLALILERFISPEGTFPVFGRSITYRMATMQPLALMAQYQKLPPGIINGQVRAGLTAVMERMFTGDDNFDEKGFLALGFTGRQSGIADVYTDTGSLYMTSLAFLPLGLPATHPFWTDAAQDWTSKRAWTKQPFPIDHHWADQK